MSKTYISFVLDRSGSMSTVYEATIEGFNAYLESQRKDGEIVASLTLFDSSNNGPEIDVVYDQLSGADFPLLDAKTYQPRGMTPLYDAVGSAVTRAIEDTKDAGYDTHILVIMTDGFENSSVEYTIEDIRERIKHIEDDGWQVIFLGANQDAWSTATSMGSTTGTYVSYGNTSASVGAAMSAATFSSINYRASGQAMSATVDVTNAPFDPATVKKTVELAGKAHGTSGKDKSK